MSDRCSMQIVCRREDAPLFEKLGFFPEGGVRLKSGKLWCDLPTDQSSVVLLRQDEVDNAAWVGETADGHGDLPKGLIYYGSHGPGSDYGDGVFATMGQTLVYARSAWGSSWPAVEFNPTTGRLDRVGLKVARRYAATLKKVEAQLVAHLRQHSPELCRRKLAAKSQPSTEDPT